MAVCLPRAEKKPRAPSRQGFDDQCLGCVASHLRPVAFVTGEVIYERGDRGDEMYLVLDGSVVLRTRPTASCFDLQAQQQQQPASGAGAGGGGGSGAEKAAGKGERLAGKGDVFGEAALFPGELGPRRRESVTTLSRVLAYVLKAAALEEIADEYPEVPLSRAHLRSGHARSSKKLLENLTAALRY
jgi:CRP-like cAMP-binding protein